MNDKGILEINIGNISRDEINRILELNEGILIADNCEAAAKVIKIDVVMCANCKYAVRTKEGELNPNDIVCTYWMTDGMTSEDYCSRGEAGEYQFDENCNMEGVI